MLPPAQRPPPQLCGAFSRRLRCPTAHPAHPQSAGVRGSKPCRDGEPTPHAAPPPPARREPCSSWRAPAAASPSGGRRGGALKRLPPRALICSRLRGHPARLWQPLFQTQVLRGIYPARKAGGQRMKNRGAAEAGGIPRGCC